MAIGDIAASKPTAAVKGPPCSVCQALETLPVGEAVALRALLADKTWRYTELAERLAADPDTPLDIPHGTLARHAKGRCAARDKLR